MAGIRARSYCWVLIATVIFAHCAFAQGLGAPLEFTKDKPASVPSMFPLNTPQSGFCSNGVYPTTVWPGHFEVQSLLTWGSYCAQGDAGTGWKTSKTVTAQTFLTLYVAGYPGTSQVYLGISNLQTGEVLPLRFFQSPREVWQLQTFRLPPRWRGQTIQVVASDQSTKTAGWVGFSEPTSSDMEPTAAISAPKIGSLALLFTMLLFLPSIAACSLAVLKGVKDQLHLAAVALLTLGSIGYISFWVYFESRKAGIVFSYLTLIASCVLILLALASKHCRRRLRPLQELIPIGAVLLLGSTFVLSLGLLHGDHGSILLTPSTRYAPPHLGADNYIPKIFADSVLAGHIPKPLHADWLSSDRPPLQTGHILWTYTWVPETDRELSYLICSVVLQCTFVIGLWNFLRATGISCKALVVAVASSFSCGFVYLNALYTWPKLYAAAFLLVIAGYVLTGKFCDARRSAGVGAVIGGLVGFSMLAHGGSAYALLGIGLTMLILRRFPSWSFLFASAVVAFLLYFPWMLYQKRVDPPGDRLLKWHIAGVKPPQPNESFSSLLMQSYRKLSMQQIIQLKLGNFKTVVGNPIDDINEYRSLFSLRRQISRQNRIVAAASLRRSMFFHWAPCIGLSVLGIPALFAGLFKRYRNQREFVVASRMWLCIALTIPLWCLIEYGPDYAAVYQGTYLTVIFAVVGAWLAFWSVSRVMAVALAAVQIAYNAILYIWLTPVDMVLAGIPGIDPVFSGFRGMAVLCASSALATFAVLVLVAREEATM